MTTYCYMWIDPRNALPFYVGIGNANRLRKPRRAAFVMRVVESIRKAGLRHFVVVHSAHETRQAAADAERTLISIFKPRRDGGVLTNCTAGGDGGDTWSGRKHSQETKRKMRIAAVGRSPTTETRAKLSAALKGKKLSAGARQKMSLAGKGRRQSPEHVRKRIAAMTATRWPRT